MIFTLLFKPSFKPFSLHVILHGLLHYLLLALVFSNPIQAEFWLNDNLYIDNNHYLQLNAVNINSKNNSSDKDSTTSLRLLPEFYLVQNIPAPSLASKITIGSKFDLQATNTHTNINGQTETHSQAIINELQLITAINPYWSFTLGRQKIAYAQQDLFSTSLNKNDQRPTPLKSLTFSQGLLTTLRLGIVEQSLLLNQKNEKNGNKPSVHYQLKVGIPGYKVGPLTLLLSRENKVQYLAQDSFLERNTAKQAIHRVMIGSAMQFPLKFITGDWQWAFQYASELNNEVSGDQKAWQTSFSWLGFIPNHKVGILFSHTDAQWTYSDDFIPDKNQAELRYQWSINQRLILELDTSTTDFGAIEKNIENEMTLSVHFKF